ncbi:patatin-like phospholipase family protein [Leeia oryzae]|uniref:patatin-like phospholipase family protein n=1 Tax=Leeia oryzae TaxID=356662 RepID=UPI00036D6370|nr:patatin-like phospholipase family protein [Leeia oryzae]
MTPTFIRRLLLPVFAALLAACSTPPVKNPASPQVVAPKPVIKPKAPVKIALVLGGGAARGFAHVGVIKMLEANGIKPDMVVGTSAGSVVGALYAAGYNGFELQKMAFELDESNVSDWSLPNRGIVKGQALQDYVNKAVRNQPIEKLKLPFGAVATNLTLGKSVLFQRGNTGQAVRASSSVPGVFQPVTINGEDYVDGGVISQVPIRYAKQMGAGFTIAIDVSGKPGKSQATSTKEVLLKSLSIMSKTLREQELKEADILISPNVGDIAPDDFDSKNRAILEGEQAAIKLMPLIKKKLAALH